MIKLQHPDDKNTAYLPKLVILFGLYLSCANVLILPYDVVNTKNDGDLDMESLWIISFYATAIFLFFLIPFAYFYYENESDPFDREESENKCGDTQLCQGLKWSILLTSSFFILIIISYYAIYETTNDDDNDITQQNASNTDDVTFTEFATGVLAFLGWFVFVIFAGMGLIALPYDLFNEFRFRPKPIDINKYAQEKKKIGERAKLLKKAGEELKTEKLRQIGKRVSRRHKREFQVTMNKFENALYLLKRDFYHLQMSYKKRGGNPIWYWVKLLVSIIGGSISIMWYIHIIIFILPDDPEDDFLNTMFDDLTDNSFPVIGVMAFSCYAFWLLLCVIKGNFRFGLRFAFCCPVFPVELENTLYNAFLVNTWLILLSSIVVVQFCAIAFPVYAENTEINKIFNQKLMTIGFFEAFFENHVFIYTLLIMSGLTGVWLWCCPKNKALSVEKELNEIMKGDKKINRKQLELVVKR